MRTSFFEIGGVINTDLRPAAVGPYCTPNFSEFGTHLPMRPRQTHRIPPLLLGKLEAYSVLHTTYLWVQTQNFLKNVKFWCALGNAHQNLILTSNSGAHWTMRTRICTIES